MEGEATNLKSKDKNADKSKAQLKAERREKQEKERAAKAAKKLTEQGQDGASTKIKPANLKISKNVQADDPKLRKKNAKKLEKQQIPLRIENQKKVGLFSHLHQYDRNVSITKKLSMGICTIHPVIIRLGLQYAEGMISGSNARCAALIFALKKVIQDYQTPPQKELSRHLDAMIKPCISFLDQCRPLSISMGNAIKFIKLKITTMSADISDDHAKAQLCKMLDDYLNVNINLASKAISSYASKKITNNDVVLVFGGSSLITKVLKDAKERGIDFRVIVADARPRLSGRNVSKKLISFGIPCSYVLINATPFIMPQVTKVLIGAHGLLSNGYVMSAVGTALISLAAKARNIPVLVCCETYKFCERVQTDAFVNNEIGDPMDLLEVVESGQHRPLIDRDTWDELDCLKVLHLTYDVTPPSLVDAVITELGMIPCSSVPVVLRLKSSES